MDKVYIEEDRLKLKSSLLIAKSLVLEKLGKIEPATRCIQDSVEIERELNNPGDLAMALHSLAKIQMKKAVNLRNIRNKQQRESLLNNALDNLKESREISEGNKHKEGIAKVLTTEAKAFAYFKKFPEAIDKIDLSIKLEDERKSKTGKSKALSVKGNILEKQGENLKLAEAIYLKSLELRQNDKKGASLVLYRLGNLLFNQKKYLKSAEYLLKGYEFKRDIKDKKWLERLPDLLYKTIIKLSESGKKKEALNCCKEALKIAPDNFKFKNIYRQLNNN